MKKHYIQNKVRKLLCVVLSMAMTTGGLSGTGMAAYAEAAEESVSAVQLDCGTESLSLPDNGKSVNVHLSLTERDGHIRQKIRRADVLPGGVFRDMVVSGVSNDSQTIRLELTGVPDLSGEDEGGRLQGTMEFPGAIFGLDGSVGTAVEIIAGEVKKTERKPFFYPYLDGIRETGDTVEMRIILIPLLGTFSEAFSEDDICFGRGLKDAQIRMFGEAGNGCYEMVCAVPKKEMEADAGGYSCFGGIILSGKSMTDPAGKAYEKALYSVREYSLETAGRDLSVEDVSVIQNAVGVFSNTAFGMIGTAAGGGLSAAGAGYTMLSLAGVIPDSPDRASLADSLKGIGDMLRAADEKSAVMAEVLDAHARRMQDAGIVIDEQYLGGFRSELEAMVDSIDLLGEEIKTPRIREQIEEAVERVAGKYQVPQEGIGRDFEEDYDMVVDDEDFASYQEDYEYVPEPEEVVYAEELTDAIFAELLVEDIQGVEEGAAQDVMGEGTLDSADSQDAAAETEAETQAQEETPETPQAETQAQ